MTRLYYIDNLRVFTLALVVLHHFSIAYGATGDWYYVEGQAQSLIENVLLVLFVATNQAFFMGLLFFISAFFVSSSYKSKGARTFLRDRLVRLGIPTVFYYFLLGPFTSFLAYYMQTEDSPKLSFGHYLKNGWGRGFGAMWFVETLIIFTFVFVLIRKLGTKDIRERSTAESFPATWKILVFCLTLGIVTFLVRTLFPVGWWLPHLNLQLAHFPQYLAMLVTGVIAWQRGWLESLTLKQGIHWFVGINVSIVLLFPTIFIFGGAHAGQTEPFMGGCTWQSLAYSIYEQVVGVGLMVGLLGIFKGTFSFRTRILKVLSDSGYTVYIIHSIPLLLIARSFRHWGCPLLLKFVILSGPALVVTFSLAWLIRSIPGVHRIL